MKLASAHRFRPCSVFIPELSPPWARHTNLPRNAALRHCNWDRFDRAWHRGTGTSEPKRVIWVLLDIGMPNHSIDKFSHHPMDREIHSNSFDYVCQEHAYMSIMTS